MGKLDRNTSAVWKKVKAFEARLKRDPLKAWKLRYTSGRGFTSEPFKIQTDVYSGSISVLPDPANTGQESAFEPSLHRSDVAAVLPLDVLTTRWATFIAFRVVNKSPDWRMRLTWFKKSEPSESPVFLLDPVGNEYYFPVASDLKGYVVPGSPRTGIIAFEPLRRSTEQLQVKFAGVKLSPDRGDAAAFSFDYRDDRLGEASRQVVESPTLVEELQEAIEAEERKLRGHIKRAHSGCAIVFAATLSAAFALSLACLW